MKLIKKDQVKGILICLHIFLNHITQEALILLNLFSFNYYFINYKISIFIFNY
jgi:hypothetical protein